VLRRCYGTQRYGAAFFWPQTVVCAEASGIPSASMLIVLPPFAGTVAIEGQLRGLIAKLPTGRKHPVTSIATMRQPRGTAGLRASQRVARPAGRCATLVNAAKIAVRRAQRLSWRQKTGETGISKRTAERSLSSLSKNV
jgi:hypothetical protein